MDDFGREIRNRTWLDLELEDNFDEELEMELDDQRIARELRDVEA